MGFFGVLALILLTLVGYSSGAIIAGRGRKEPLSLLDFGMAVLFLLLALGTQSFLGKWLAIPIWLILAGLGSALLTAIRYRRSETEEAARKTTSETSRRDPLRRTWDWWKVFAAEIGNYQGRLLFAFFYFIIVTLFGIGVTLFSDPLAVKHKKRTTSWVQRSSVSHELEEARGQF